MIGKCQCGLVDELVGGLCVFCLQRQSQEDDNEHDAADDLWIRERDDNDYPDGCEEDRREDEEDDD